MQTKIFDGIRNAALSIGLMILLPLITTQIADIVFPRPARSSIVTTEYSRNQSSTQDTQRKKEQKNYNSLLQVAQQKQFYITGGSGLVILLAGTFTPIPTIGTGLILGGLSSLTFGYMQNWDGINKIVRLISLLCAVAILLFAGMKFWKE